MSVTKHSVSYGGSEILFQLRLSKRKSLEISVHPDKSIFVKAPEKTPLNIVEERVKKRARWIKRQVRYFGQFDPRTPTRKLVSGESHLYLGKKYRLRLEEGEVESVRLRSGFITIESKELTFKNIEKLLNEWYRTKADLYINKTFIDCWAKFRKKELDRPTVRIMKLKKRWGSLSKAGTLSINVDLIKAPKECIEYVIIHELCHLVHHDHSTEFFNLLERSLPDWVKRKHKLEMALV